MHYELVVATVRTLCTLVPTVRHSELLLFTHYESHSEMLMMHYELVLAAVLHCCHALLLLIRNVLLMHHDGRGGVFSFCFALVIIFNFGTMWYPATSTFWISKFLNFIKNKTALETVCLFVCLFYQAESTWGVLDRSSASLAALPGEASPTRACLGAIAGHRKGNTGIKGNVDSMSR